VNNERFASRPTSQELDQTRSQKKKSDEKNNENLKNARIYFCWFVRSWLGIQDSVDRFIYLEMVTVSLAFSHKSLAASLS